jgi:hypothetical protein
MVTTVARTFLPSSGTTDPGPVRSRKASTRIPSRTANFNRLALQLSLDPAVRSFEYLESLHVEDCSIPVAMLVALRGERSVAFDIVDERPVRDLDAEGLLLIALQQNGIDLEETDGAAINAEPRAGNCLRIWNWRGRTDDGVRRSIEAALTENGSLSIAALGPPAGLRDPMSAVCSLVFEGILELDLSIELDADSHVTLATDRARPPVSSRRSARRSPR